MTDSRPYTGRKTAGLVGRIYIAFVDADQGFRETEDIQRPYLGSYLRLQEGDWIAVVVVVRRKASAVYYLVSSVNSLSIQQ